MQVELAYGQTGLSVDFPDSNTTVVESVFAPGILDEERAITESLQHPLGAPPLTQMINPSDSVAIVVCDATRAMPSKRVLPVILKTLQRAGIHPGRISIINALGTHRPSPRHELIEFLGDGIVEKYRIVQHDCTDYANMACAGRLSNGSDLWVNRDYYEADLKILTGLIEPHFFAGFSGGGKLVLPGIASLENIMESHSYAMLSDPGATWGITDGNPVWEQITEAAELTCPSFVVNIALNRDRQITGVFSGELRTAHAAGVQHVKRSAMRTLPSPFDIVVTTNSGYPLDRNVYQTVKGMTAARGIVKKGGAIVIASECRDGIPTGSSYQKLLSAAGDPASAMRLLADDGFAMPDQWQVQMQAQVQLHARVFLYSTGLRPEEIHNAMLIPCLRIEDTIDELMRQYGPGASICILPEGPETIPYLSDGAENGGCFPP